MSEEARRRLSESHKGKTPWNKGIPSKFKGVPRSESTKEKISANLKGKMTGENNPNYGKRGVGTPFFGHHHTADTRNKISESLKGRVIADDVRQKISQSGKGKSTTLGMHWSEETKAK